MSLVNCRGLGEVIDVLIREDVNITLGLKFVSDNGVGY